jgi:hypothetical protein
MDINLHAGQSEVFEDMFVKKTVRHGVVNCSRGWGKSHLAAVAGATAIGELITLRPKVPNKNVYIIAPTYEQVTDIYYPLLNDELGLGEYAIKSSRDKGRFWFGDNVELRLLSYEAIERMRGKGAYFVVNDEPCSWTKGVGLQDAWESIIEPCIATRWSPKRARLYNAPSPGRSLTIGTPKGYNYFYDMFNFRETDPSWGSYHYDYLASPLLEPEEIEKLRHKMDPIRFASEYLASFEESGNSVFYCFDRKIHVRTDLPDFRKPEAGVKGEDVHVCIDFNVGIQASTMFALRGNQMHFLDEVKGHPDTETLAKYIVEKYKGHKIYVYPDPTGNARKTSAAVGATDFSILRSHGLDVRAHVASPGIVDSANAVNRKLMTAAGDIDMYFHPRCAGAITSVERTVWTDRNPDIATIDKSAGVEHFSDGIRYGTEYLFPVLAGIKRTKRGFNF